jgi:hypothetical protein
MSREIAVLKYVDTALPTGSTTVTLVNIAKGAFQYQGGGAVKYTLRLRNSHAGTVRFRKSDDGITFVTIRDVAFNASTSGYDNKVNFSLNAYPYFQVQWVNGGVTQTTFDPMQGVACDDTDADEHQETAARVRGCVSDVLNNIAVQAGTTHITLAVPAAWPGRRVCLSVVGTALTGAGLPPTVWYQFGTADSIAVDRTAFGTGTPPAYTGNVNIGKPIPHGGAEDVYVDPTWTHISFEADTASTGFYGSLTDYPPTNIE